MKLTARLATLLLPLFLCAGVMAEEPSAPRTKVVDPGAVKLTDLDGNAVEPLVAEEGGYAVVIFINTDCPIANAYVPKLNKLRETLADKKLKWTLLHANVELTTQDAAAHQAEYKLTHPIAVDAKHEAVKALGATVTPEAFVIDAAGNIVYRGLIDNQYSGYGDRRVDITKDYLHDALAAAVEGKVPEVAVTKPLGCFIEP